MKIVQSPNPVLSAKAKKVDFFDKKLAAIIHDMSDTLLAAVNPKGVGLAAPQIGLSWRIFIAKPTQKIPITVYINPEIVALSKKPVSGPQDSEKRLEGCLSIGNIWGNVKRASTVTLKYQDETGNWHTEKFTGLMAVIVQHEMDHLDGILFTQRVLEQKGRLYQAVKDEKLEEVRI